MTLKAALIVTGVYLGVYAANVFGLVGDVVFYVCALIAGGLIAVADIAA